jgi:hypothetical protein
LGVSDLSGQQRKLLADRLFQAAIENAGKAHTPPDPADEGDAVSASARNYAQAALALTQAFTTAMKLELR